MLLPTSGASACFQSVLPLHSSLPLSPLRPPAPAPPATSCQAGADPWKVIRAMREKLRLNAAAVQVPIGSEDALRGLVDLIDCRAFVFEGASGETIVGE